MVELNSAEGTVTCLVCGRTRDLPLDVHQVAAYVARFERVHGVCPRIAAIAERQLANFGELADPAISLMVKEALEHVDP